MQNGFARKTTSKRVECGSGVYTFALLEDANAPYAKKTYGNYVIAIELDSVELLHTTKLEAMKSVKNGIAKDFCYNVQYLGDVVVLNSLNKIKSYRYSNDNGKTWFKN